MDSFFIFRNGHVATSGNRCRADPLDNHLIERFGVTEAFHCVKNLDPEWIRRLEQSGTKRTGGIGLIPDGLVFIRTVG